MEFIVERKGIDLNTDCVFLSSSQELPIVKDKETIFLKEDILEVNKVRLLNKFLSQKEVYFGYSFENIFKIASQLIEENALFFCYEPVSRLEDLRKLIDIGVDLVVIEGSLCFDIENIGRYCHSSEVSIMLKINESKAVGGN